MKACRAFTIAELVVVISMIAVLAAILFPTFSRARESTRALSCRANLLNIFMALRIYASDFAGYLPPDPPGLSCLTSLGLIDSRTLQCPSAPYRAMGEREEGEVPAYLYVPNLRYPPGVHTLLVADTRPRHNNAANALFSDGAIRLLPLPRWLAAVPRPIGEALGIFPPAHSRGGGDQP